MPAAPPLILTATLDEALFAAVDGLRRRHFPPALNRISAHVTLFHKLPGDALEAVTADIRAACATVVPIPVSLPTLRFLGKGTAAEIDAADLIALRNRLATRWADDLTPQDRQKFKPHVTLQNKVDPGTARATFERLTRSWEVLRGVVVGLTLWHYLGGPWALADSFELASSVNAARDDERREA